MELFLNEGQDIDLFGICNDEALIGRQIYARIHNEGGVKISTNGHIMAVVKQEEDERPYVDWRQVHQKPNDNTIRLAIDVNLLSRLAAALNFSNSQAILEIDPSNLALPIAVCGVPSWEGEDVNAVGYLMPMSPQVARVSPREIFEKLTAASEASTNRD